MNTSAITIIVISLTMLFLITTSIVDARRAKKAVRNRIKESWGKEPEAEYKNEDLESIASYFSNRRKKSASSFTIDDTTWRDLEMDDVFMRLNSTATTAGEETLYRLLREPSFDVEVLKARQRLIDFFRTNHAERVTIQLILAKLGKRRLINVTNYFYQPACLRPWKSRSYKILSAAALMSPLFLFLNAGLGALLIILSFMTNMIVYYNMRFEIASDLGALGYIVRLVQCVRRLIDADLVGLGQLKHRLESKYRKVSKIGKRGFYLFFAGTGSLTDLAGEYLKIILLKELIDYEYLRNAAVEHRDELIEVYDTVGLIDSLISVASYRASLPLYCVPNLDKCAPDSRKHLDFEDIYHPLIKNAVPNSLVIDQSVLVTGSNASGKSTLLRTVAINAILAQSICTCLARSYSSSMFAVFTSMALRDSTRDGESYFIAEIKSIKRILDYLNDAVPCLCLIDEVLRGTNTVERIAASSEVLLHLARQNCTCIAATHDIELTFILENCYRNVHFQEAITDDGIVFDYKQRDGRATSRNAIRLLQLMGYGAAIVEEAEKRASNFVSQGSWKQIRG